MNSFDEIYRRNYSSVFRIACKMMEDADEASDIAQEVFVSLYTRMQKNDEIRHPKSWLCGAAVNKCVDKQRYNNRFRRIVTEEETAEMTPENDSFDGGENELSFAISKLNRDERGLVVLYSEGLSYKEIAEATGIKFTSVGKTLSRTLKKIEKELRKMKV